MVRLNRNLRKALAIALPYNGKEGLNKALDDESFDLRGLTDLEFLKYLQELERLGLVAVEETNGEDLDFVPWFTSDATSYFFESKIEVAKTIGKYFFQLLVGAGGGVVVLVLEKTLF